jgi:transposase-like protein
MKDPIYSINEIRCPECNQSHDTKEIIEAGDFDMIWFDVKCSFVCKACEALIEYKAIPLFQTIIP